MLKRCSDESAVPWPVRVYGGMSDRARTGVSAVHRSRLPGRIVLSYVSKDGQSIGLHAPSP
jgi:hypothetical protein